MTDDELDLLASTYVDGEATPEEVALVERDPELQARVAEFRALQATGPVTPPPGLADRQIAAALAEFEAIRATGDADTGTSAGPEPADADVVDFSQRRAAGGGRGGGAGGTGAGPSNRRSERPTRGLPSWLPAAAVFLLIGGGLIWVVGQGGGSDDSDETAGAELAEDTDASADAVGAADAEESTESDSGDDDAMEDSAAEAFEASDGDDAATEPTQLDEDAEADEEAAEDEAADDDGESQNVAREPRAFFTQVPPVDDIDFSPDDLLVIEESVCGPEVAEGDLGQPLGFLPVEIAGQPAELLVFADADGAEVRVLVDDLCQPLEPTN